MTPAQQLAVVVPADAVLEVEAMVSNRDIGFVHPGQDAQIKVDTFNFTRYGLLHGRVVSVSPDAMVRETPQDRNNYDKTRGAESESSEPKGQEFVYSARISLIGRKSRSMAPSPISLPEWRSPSKSERGREP